MGIKFYGPIDEGIAKNLREFRMEGEIPLNEFSRKLVKRFPCLGDYPTGKNAISSIQFFPVARKGTLLIPGDRVKGEDELESVGP